MRIHLYFYAIVIVLVNFSLIAESTRKIRRLDNSSKIKLAYSITPGVEDVDLHLILPYCKYCFVHINLYSHVDSLPTQTPTILTRFSPVNIANDEATVIGFVPTKLYLELERKEVVTLSGHNQSMWCGSKLFESFHFNFCTEISKTKFIIKSRSWNFEHYFYLLPPLGYHNLNQLWSGRLHSENKQLQKEILCIVFSEMETAMLWFWAKTYQFYSNLVRTKNLACNKHEYT